MEQKTLPLKTLRGSSIKRDPFYGVGKKMKGWIYVHRDYAEEVVPKDALYNAQDLLEKVRPDLEWNCIKYHDADNTITFQEASDFDTAREPMVGQYVIIHPDGRCKRGFSESIFHHKWLWVMDDYEGFDVRESWLWSKYWLSLLPETAIGTNQEAWLAQLKKYDI